MEVAQGVHRFGSRFVNWYVVEDGRALTLVDAGLLGQWSQFTDAVERLGRRMADVEAIVLTHAHVDHTGFAERARTAASAAVHAHPADTGGGRARKLPPLWLYARPSSWPWLLHDLRNLALLAPAVRAPRPFGDGDTLDVPGRPRVVHTPGHTAGSCVLHLANAGVLFSGDALVTYDPYRNLGGPRLLLDGVNEDTRQAVASLDRLERLDVEVLLPGHGDPWTGGVAQAVTQARGDPTVARRR